MREYCLKKWRYPRNGINKENWRSCWSSFLTDRLQRHFFSFICHHEPCYGFRTSWNLSVWSIKNCQLPNVWHQTSGQRQRACLKIIGSFFEQLVNESLIVKPEWNGWCQLTAVQPPTFHPSTFYGLSQVWSQVQQSKPPSRQPELIALVGGIPRHSQASTGTVCPLSAQGFLNGW